MKSTKPNLIATIVVTGTHLALGAVAAPPNDAEPSSTNPAYEEALEIIEQALEADESEFTALRQAAEQVAGRVAANQLVQQLLADAPTKNEPAGDQAEHVRTLRAALREAADVLRFRRVDEAPLPEGFPEPVPVGEIRVQPYPAYRMARTPIENGQNRAFWTLFRHIQENQIGMTAPVEMTFEFKGRDSPLGREMAFLYRTNEEGQLGPAGDAEVVDVPPQTVVSLGWRGDITPENVARAGKLLSDWLDQHREQYEPIGRLRVMGYNSPMVPVDRRYFEVQIPVQRAP